ncbi:MAG TPA: hypothetical protein VFO46_17110 [Candidatus Sulfotelmatobacter sp.]|nr:hypothetical protein [Candidatus Sulfotelmatobacter sp.]
MITVGVDFHPEFQQIALVDKETGEFQEKRLAGNPPGGPDGAAFYWAPQNLENCFLNLGRSATALWRVLRHQGMPEGVVTQEPWKT